MTTLSDAIRAVVGGTSVNDGLKAYFAANGGVGTTLPDLERSFLISQLGLSAPVSATTNDLWRQLLASFTGSLPDQLLQFWLAGGAVESWTPAQLFLASEQGVWLDPSDFATLFQDSLGTTPVTAVGQPVGLALDKRLPTTSTAPLDAMDFVAAGSTPPTVANTTFLSEPCGSVVFPANGGGYTVSRGASSTTHPIVIGGRYTHSYRVALSRPLTGGESIVVLTTGSHGSDSFITLNSSTASGTWIDFADATVISSALQAGVNSCYVYAGSAIASPITVYVRKYTVKYIPGNHATQATAASRPVLSARKNLLLDTEGLVASYDTCSNVIQAATTVPGFSNAVHFNDDVAVAYAYKKMTPNHTTGATYRLSVYVQMDDGLAPAPGGNNSSADFGLVIGGAIVTSPETASLGSGLYRVEGSVVASTPNQFGIVKWAANTARTFKVTGYQVEQSATATRYQRVNTDTDYDTVGFPHYLNFDGVDDSAATAAGGGATTSAVIVMGFRTAAIGAAQTLFSDRSGNTGLKLEVTAGGNIAFSGGNGASIDTATGAAVAANTDYVVTAKYDGTNLSVQLNRGTATTTACALSAGTAAITLGKDNGAATGFHNGRRYGTVYAKNAAKSAGEIASAEAYMAAKMGVTL